MNTDEFTYEDYALLCEVMMGAMVGMTFAISEARHGQGMAQMMGNEEGAAIGNGVINDGLARYEHMVELQAKLIRLRNQAEVDGL